MSAAAQFSAARCASTCFFAERAATILQHEFCAHLRMQTLMLVENGVKPRRTASQIATKMREKQGHRTGQTRRQAQRTLQSSAKDANHEAYLAHKLLQQPEQMLRKLGITDPQQMQQLQQLLQSKSLPTPETVAMALQMPAKVAEAPPPSFV